MKKNPKIHNRVIQKILIKMIINLKLQEKIVKLKKWELVLWTIN